MLKASDIPFLEGIYIGRHSVFAYLLLYFASYSVWFQHCRLEFYLPPRHIHSCSWNRDFTMQPRTQTYNKKLTFKTWQWIRGVKCVQPRVTTNRRVGRLSWCGFQWKSVVATGMFALKYCFAAKMRHVHPRLMVSYPPFVHPKRATLHYE
jgi:hypothetical protein